MSWLKPRPMALKRYAPSSRNWATKCARCYARKATRAWLHLASKHLAWWSAIRMMTAYIPPRNFPRRGCRQPRECRCNATSRKASRLSASGCSAWTSCITSTARWQAWKKRCRRWSNPRCSHDSTSISNVHGAGVACLTKVKSGSILPVQQPGAAADILQPQGTGKRLGIGNAAFAACIEQFLHGHGPQFQELVGIQLLRAGIQLACEENMDDLGGIGDGQMHGARMRPLAPAKARFFQQLALCADQRVFTGIQLASGKLRHDPADRVAEL